MRVSLKLPPECTDGAPTTPPVLLAQLGGATPVEVSLQDLLLEQKEVFVNGNLSGAPIQKWNTVENIYSTQKYSKQLLCVTKFYNKLL